jgi:putative glutamine amidotransferase
MKTKIYIVWGSPKYANWIDNRILVDSPEDADILLFTGGPDVDPTYYGEKPHPTTFCHKERDEIEFDIFNKYPNKFKLGICKGAQLLTVANGGKLIQHSKGHNNSIHDMRTYDGKEFLINSDHHQMMYPFLLPIGSYKVIAWASTSLSDEYWFNDKICHSNINKELEVVWYPKTRSLCIQSHPEWASMPVESIDYFKNLLNDYRKQK